MSATSIDHSHFSFEKKLSSQATSLSVEFKKITRFYVFFQFFFAFMALAQLFAFAIFFSFWIHSSAIAFLIAGFFLTGFSYFVLQSYFQNKKPQQLEELSRSYAFALREEIGETDHLSIAHAIYRMVNFLDRIECHYYKFPFQWETANVLLQKFSVYCHFSDVLKMKELLLLEAIFEHISLIKEQPTDLEAHASLAEGYMKLAGLYKVPSEEMPHSMIPAEFFADSMQLKLKQACERAIEEFKIIEVYVPRDPWIHAQLAAVYHDLGDKEREIAEYETMLNISPQDRAVMYYLGVLYFQQGRTAQGLQVYDQLSKLHDQNAASLLTHYDAFSMEAFG